MFAGSFRRQQTANSRSENCADGSSSQQRANGRAHANTRCCPGAFLRRPRPNLCPDERRCAADPATVAKKVPTGVLIDGSTILTNDDHAIASVDQPENHEKDHRSLAGGFLCGSMGTILPS